MHAISSFTCENGVQMCTTKLARKRVNSVSRNVPFIIICYVILNLKIHAHQIAQSRFCLHSSHNFYQPPGLPSLHFLESVADYMSSHEYYPSFCFSNTVHFTCHLACVQSAHQFKTSILM